jgi:LHFPL tetraspan subfamily member protein
MLIMISLFTPHWLIAGSNPSQIVSNNVTVTRYPSFGLSSRCKKLSSGSFECATFSLTTSTEVFPFFWKLAYCFMCLSFALLCITTLCALISFCRQSFMGKSLHSVTGSLQILSMIFAMISTFTYPLGWSTERITNVCIDLSPYYPGECNLGYSFYAAIAGIVVATICGILSLKAEKSTLNPSIKTRIEEGNERLVFAK